MPNLTGKVALITGSGSGIGAHTAIHFVTLGCKVAINGRNVEKLEKIYQKCIVISKSPDQILIVAGDVSDAQQRVDIVEKTVQHFKQLDILVNNAGIYRGPAFDATTDALYESIMNTNVKSLFFLSQLAVPHLKKTKGNIVNVSSVSGQKAFNCGAVYSVSKAAVDHFTRNLALELGPDQIRVNSISPGLIITDIFTAAGTSQEIQDMFITGMATQHALGRVGLPDEIAKPIAFLASDEASFITGACLLVDGGINLKSSGVLV